MSNNIVNNHQNELAQAVAKGSNPIESKGQLSNASIALSTASTSHLAAAMHSAVTAAAATNPTILNMISAQRRKEEHQQQQMAHIIETLATQVEDTLTLAKGGQVSGDNLGNLLGQSYLAQDEEETPFSNAFSTLMGPSQDLSSLAMIAQESRKLDGDDEGKNGKLTDEASTGSSEENKEANGRDAIFAAAGAMSELKGKQENNLEKDLENEIKMLEAQLKGMIATEQFMQKMGKVLTNYLANPSEANLDALINLLKSHFAGDSSIENKLNDIQKLANELNSLGGIFGWDVFENWFGGFGEWIAQNMPIPELGDKTINKYLEGLTGQASGNPALFAEFMKKGQKDFEKDVQRLISQISELTMLLDVVEGKGMNAVFDMESLLMKLEQVVIGNNSKEAKQKAQMAQAVMKGLDASMTKLMDARKKLIAATKKKSHHGIFGDIFDFFKSLIKKIGEIVKGVCEEVGACVAADLGFEGAAKAMAKDGLSNLKSSVEGFVKFVGNIVDACKDVVKGIKSGDFNEVLKGFTKLATDAILVAVGGPILGPMLADSKFAKDMGNMAKIMVDAVGALGQVIVAGVEKLLGAMGDKQAGIDGDTNLANCKKLGEDILTNPQFSALMDVVAIVMIVASVASQQYWLAGLMTVMLVANDFGGTQLIEKGIADVIEFVAKDVFGAKLSKKDKEWIKAVSDVLLIVAVMATGSFSGAFEAGVETGVKEGAELAVDDLGEGIQAVSEESSVVEDEVVNGTKQESENAVKKAAKWTAGKAKAFLQNNGAALVTFGTTLGTTTTGVDIAKAIGGKHEKELERILGLIQEIVAIVFSIAGAGGMALQDSTSTLSNKINGLVRKLDSTLADYMENNLASLTKMAALVQSGGMIAQGGAQMGQGALVVLQGKILKEISEFQSAVSVFEATEKDNNASIQKNNQNLKSIMKGYDQIIKNMDAPSLAGQGVADALLQNA